MFLRIGENFINLGRIHTISFIEEGDGITAIAIHDGEETVVYHTTLSVNELVARFKQVAPIRDLVNGNYAVAFYEAAERKKRGAEDLIGVNGEAVVILAETEEIEIEDE